MKVPRGGLLARTLAATLTGLLVVGALAAAVGAERAVDHARSARARELRLFAVATAARMQPLSSLQRARLARRLSAATRLDAEVIPRAHAPARAASRGLTAVDGRALVEVAEPLDPWEVLRVRAPADAPGGPLLGTLARVLAVLLAAGALGVAVSLAVARDIASELRAVTAQADALRRASHAPGGPLPVHGGDEVGDVVSSFNQLRRVFDVELARHGGALAALEETERRRDAWLTTLRHELRTPLNAILGFAEALEERVYGALSDEQRRAVGEIRQSGLALQALSDDVLDLFRAEAQHLDLDIRPVMVADLARRCLRAMQESPNKKHLATSLRLDGDVGSVEADEPRLTQILVNLWRAAAEAATERGAIGLTVAPHPTEDAVRFTVWDTGVGLSTATRERFFEAFGHTEAGHTGGRSGTGVGLALSRRLIELHGGTIEVESEAGSGTQLTVTLPRRYERPAVRRVSNV